MDAQQVVQSISLGSRVAEEEERDDLSAYFVETENWRKVFQGEIGLCAAALVARTRSGAPGCWAPRP